MNWRTVLGVCAGVLLPLPFVVLLGGLLQPEALPQPPAQGRISPVLDGEQRTRLMTYGKTCDLSSECEPPLGCLFQARSRRSVCSDSQCTTDAQCPEGQVCQVIATEGAGPLVRYCVPTGVRQEGESCIVIASNKENACAPGLLCGGQYGWCARPCHPGAAAGCPEGFFCANTIPQPVCLPSCEARGCPSGQFCVRFMEGTSVCARVYGPNCQQSPCPEGRRCEAHLEPSHPGKVWMECVVRCGKDHPPCEAGLVCDALRCIPGCDPQGPEVCADGYYCARRTERSPFACQPEYWRDFAR